MDVPDITKPSGVPITDDVVHSMVDLFELPQAEYRWVTGWWLTN